MENQNNNIVLKQHNAITEARYEMTALEKNIVYMVMAQLRDNDKKEMKYFISIQELKKKLKSLGQEISLEKIQEATGKIVTRVYLLEEESIYQISMSLFSSVIYEEGSDLIEIEILPEVRHYLFDLKVDFTSYQLDSALSLRSQYSKRIYEMLSQHKEEGVFKISVQTLKERLKIIDIATKIEKFKVWSVFAKGVLELSKKEINKKSDIFFTYTLHKTGHKYTGIEFHISKKKKQYKKEAQNQLELDI